jgi:Leucine-rich repeat (LRR) protein
MEKSNRKYMVYRNDIKYKKYRDIDPERAIWESEEVRDDFMKKDTDAIDYRVSECIREKYTMLDLSHMTETCVIELISHKEFPKIRDEVLHVFINNSQLMNIPDLDCFKKIRTLDLGNNELKKLPRLSETIRELNFRDNKIVHVPILPHLEILVGDNNNIEEITLPLKIKIASIANNPLKKIHGEYFSNLEELDINRTNMENITFKTKKLKKLNCEKTKIKTIPKMDDLKILMCDNSFVEDISSLNHLEELYQVGSNITRLHYIPTLKCLTFDKKKNALKMSKYYKVRFANKNKDSIFFVSLHTET